MTHEATFRFFADLRDFLPGHLASGTVAHAFDVPGGVKDMIEAFGVPHTEVDLMIADGRSVDFSYRVSGGEWIGVYPRFTSIDITPITEVRPERLPCARFVADNHLGRLARYLRLVGVDTHYDTSLDDPELVRMSATEGRVVLTRDVGLLKRAAVTHGYFVRSINPREQVVEVVQRFRLADQLRPFSRCMVCNGMLVPIPKEDVADRVPPRTRQHVDVYRACSSCARLYWRGAHHRELEKIVASCADPRSSA